MEESSRPNPDELLAQIKKEEQKAKKGKLKIYLGMCAGVGKTFAMLQDASRARGHKRNVLIGYVETHGRAETEFLLFSLPQIPRIKINYKGVEIEEMNLDEILKLKPELVVVDELAHTNAPGCRHKKRFLDVLELIDNGIDVYTALNVQHLESIADTVSQITGIIIRETVPDSILESADEIELVDISPEELLQRLEEGKVYTADKSSYAVKNFFRKGNLIALRELALRLTADRVDKQVRDYMTENRIPGPWKSGQRLLIGISPSPDSAKLIRWARRLAYTMEASWIAVYVETSHVLNAKQKKSLNDNIELAKDLGAEIISTTDFDIVNGIIRIAKQENVSHIIVGKSIYKNFFQNLFKTDVVNRIINASGNIDVYIYSGDSDYVKEKKKFKIPETQSGIFKYILSACIVLTISAICYPFSSFLGHQTVALILLLAVSLLPLLFGRGPVLLAAIISPMLWNYFFVPPKFTLWISKSEDILTFIMFFIIAYVTGVLTTRIRQRERAIRHREKRAVALYNLANELSKSQNINEVIEMSISNITKVFNAKVLFLFSDESGNLKTEPHKLSTYTIDEKEFSVALWVYTNKKKAGHFTDSLPFADSLFYPLKGPRGTYGSIGIKFEEDIFFEEQESLLDNFINQIGAAVERELLNYTAKKAMLFEESEKLYKTLFDSISHELKTPIAAIMSASSYLLDEDLNEKPDLRKQLYKEINIGVNRLNRLIENLLDMARLESGKMNPNLTWCDVQDLFNSVLNHFDSEFKGHNVKIEIAKNMPFIKADYILIEQVLKNIVQNAITYTPQNAQIELHSYFDDNNCYIAVSDNGPGVPESQLIHIFDKFYRINSSVTGGSGLGLSIVKGIVEAHGGTITVSNKITGGLRFLITLPQDFNNNKSVKNNID